MNNKHNCFNVTPEIDQNFQSLHSNSNIQTQFPTTQALSASNQSMLYIEDDVSHNRQCAESETISHKTNNTSKFCVKDELKTKVVKNVDNYCYNKEISPPSFQSNKKFSIDIQSISTRSFHSSSDSTISTEFGMEAGKEAAARACALKHVHSGCKLGVGSGSTVKYLVDFLKEQVSLGKLNDIKCVPTSFLTKKWLCEANLPVYSLESLPSLDVCIDGADEVDLNNLNCIKGGGGCLTQEKIVQSCSKNFFIIADNSKKSECLGMRWKTIPLEVVPFGYVPISKKIEETLGGHCSLRMAHKKCGPVITDNNCYVIDWHFPASFVNADHDWSKTNNFLINLPGIVETGLFLNVANEAFFATNEGTVEHIKKF
uniref:ribose-5-phosphate isomerase n=1 Tax=Parastrongyloides trichosuri TaxID=131310 RepID=A0A0N4ZUS1_PARTI